MASLEVRRWESDFAGLTRRDRRPCSYSVYMPDRLAGRRFVFDGDVAADIADAEAGLVRLNMSAAALADTEALARLLLRAEAVASSRIEGLDVGGRRLLRADAARRIGEDPRDVTAVEVLGNIDAMVWGVETVESGGVITIETLLEAHRRLLAGTRLEEQGGRIRTVQNWIGGSNYNPCSAVFVPPPPETVAFLPQRSVRPSVMMTRCQRWPRRQSLMLSSRRSILSWMAMAELAAYCSTWSCAGGGLGLRVLPPLSLVLATMSRDYIGGLTETRYVGPPESADAHAGINRWVALFATACRRAVEDSSRFEDQVRALQTSWRERVGHTRRDSAVNLLIGGSAGCTGAHNIYRRGADWPFVPGGQPGDQSTRGYGYSGTGQRGQPQSRLRGTRVDRGLHGIGATASESRGGHACLESRPPRASTGPGDEGPRIGEKRMRWGWTEVDHISWLFRPSDYGTLKLPLAGESTGAGKAT